MPSHKIHIKIVQDLNKVLKLDNDSIMLGSVLPDLTITKDHGLSHFQYIDDNYSIDKIDILQKLYDDCLEYIFNWLKSNDDLSF
jgi:hypothetical protein